MSNSPVTAVQGELVLAPHVVARLRERLPVVAGQTFDAVTREVGEYAALEAEVGETIQRAVQLALATFLHVAGRERDTDADDVMRPAVDGAYALGRGEARSGRTVDALLNAYRVGARVAWREWSAVAVDAGVAAASVAQFAELVFAYIDELSAASVAGHGDELVRSGRVREQYLERLAVALLDGADEEELRARAQQADWPVPGMLTAVLVPSAQVRGAAAVLAPETLVVSADLVSEPGNALDGYGVLLVPGAARLRSALLSSVRRRGAVVGPARAWADVAVSYRRARRLLQVLGPPSTEVLDTEDHLTVLVLSADPEALADLRAAELAPLAGLPAATADRLAETLRSWLLHQGRRDDVAADLHVHPQTVRYRMTQVRDLLGARLRDPVRVHALTVALGAPGAMRGGFRVGAGPRRSED